MNQSSIKVSLPSPSPRAGAAPWMCGSHVVCPGSPKLATSLSPPCCVLLASTRSRHRSACYTKLTPESVLSKIPPPSLGSRGWSLALREVVACISTESRALRGVQPQDTSLRIAQCLSCTLHVCNRPAVSWAGWRPGRGVRMGGEGPVVSALMFSVRFSVVRVFPL